MSSTLRMSLAEAVGRHVEPEMHLHFASTPSRSNAALREVARAFMGADPRFVLSATGFHSTAHLLGLLRLGRRYISCFFGDNYPTPRPNPLYSALEREGAEIEVWSLLAYVTALRAAALGVPYETTSSLVGTTLGADLAAKGRFREIVLAEGAVDKIGLVAPMRPDVAFVHAAAGDGEGHFIASPPYSEGFWGAMAATRGVIVTVERWADADLLHRYVDWIKLPSYRVLAVCEEPFGAHPQPSYFAKSDATVPQYQDDFAHYELWRRMTTEPKLFDDFVAKVLRAPDAGGAYRTFVGKNRLDELQLGAERVRANRASAQGPVERASGTQIKSALSSTSAQTEIVGARVDAKHARDGVESAKWRVKSARGEMRERERDENGPRDEAPLSSTDRLTLLAARAIVRRVRAGGYTSILAGIGASFAAARLAKLELQRAGMRIEVMVETGLIDLECGASADSFLLGYANIAHAARLTSIDDVLGTLTCGAQNRCLGVLGSAEVDAKGNINSSRLSSGEMLVGPGGANDIASSCAEVVVVAKCSPSRLVSAVHYVTSPGRNVRTIVTEHAVLSREKQGEGFSLGDVFPTGGALTDAIAHVRARSGFPILHGATTAFAEAPTAEELEALAMIHGQRTPANEHRRVGGV